MKKFLNPNPQIKSTLIYILLAIFIVISIFLLVSNYQNDKKKYEMEDDFAFFERYFKGFQKTAEKINNPGNPAEIRAAMYFVLDSKYSFAKNAMYSDKFIYIKADRIMKYTLSNGKKLYIFENADVKSKKTHKTISKNYIVYIMDGNLFCSIEYNGKFVDSMTTRHTDPESAKKILNEKKLEIAKKRGLGHGNAYVFLFESQ